MKTTAPGQRGSNANEIKRGNSITTYKHLNASIVSVLMWLSVIGGALC